MTMTSSKPYLARAIYEWLVDNQMTPYILVAAHHAGTRVPGQFVQDGRIVLNVAPMAVQALLIGAEETTFSARFAGVPWSIIVPHAALLAIYAKENGQGMFFEEESPEPSEPTDPIEPVEPVESTPKAEKKPGLRLVR